MTVHPNSELRQKLFDFTESLGGDPQAMRLMDEVRTVAHQLYQLNEASLEAAGLSYAQFRILMSLLFSEWQGSEAGLNPSEISDQQGTSRNTISALIRSLEESGLIERRLDQQDRRRFHIRLTEAGRHKLRNHAQQHVKTTDDIFAALSAEEMETLSNLLRKLNRCAHTLKEQSSPHTGGHFGGSHATSR
ncbi:MarR family winged helix-turn-helix transcriptional regulator [Promineifilum sp.]|uniref:MarR family winged helix-turn-helix transcriptional regulator n=1 Tax=Promineifilum sp. TaxID=2664178 RepID=UPI0035B188F5